MSEASQPASPQVPEPASRPTDRWLAAAADVMPPLQGPAGTAERLLLLIHYGIDWQQGWVTRYRTTYWDQLLPDRIVIATFRAATLRRWWREIANELGSQPRSSAERTELEHLLRAESLPVLEVLRLEAEALLLRTRIVSDAVRTTRLTRWQGPPAGDPAAPPDRHDVQLSEGPPATGSSPHPTPMPATPAQP